MTDIEQRAAKKFAANRKGRGYNTEKIGRHFLEILPKICPKESERRV